MKTTYSLLLGAGLLAGCHSASEKTTAKPADAPPAATAPTATAAAPAYLATPPFTGYHRYRGTVGGQPVTLALTIGPSDAPDSTGCYGSYCYDRHPAGQLLLAAPRAWRPGQVLQLTEADGARPRTATGTWQAVQPAGPALSGTWTSPGGQQLPFSLREDYTDGHGHLAAVQYELLQEGEEEPTPAERQPGESKAAYQARTQDLTNSSHRDYLHLLGPDTLRPELRALQCPVPAQRRRQLREDLGYPGGVELRNELTVVYNDHGLLSLTSFYNGDFKDAPHPEHGAGAVTYDLRTGRALTIAGLIRPGADTVLSRLIARHLASDEQLTADDLMSTVATATMPVPLPQQGLGVVAEGLSFTYTGSEILSIVYPPVTLVVPWVELRPLLRPDSPVARMLRERGPWRP